jgi:hypothetical protein
MQQMPHVLQSQPANLTADEHRQHLQLHATTKTCDKQAGLQQHTTIETQQKSHCGEVVGPTHGSPVLLGRVTCPPLQSGLTWLGVLLSDLPWFYPGGQCHSCCGDVLTCNKHSPISNHSRDNQLHIAKCNQAIESKPSYCQTVNTVDKAWASNASQTLPTQTSWVRRDKYQPAIAITQNTRPGQALW